MSRENAQAAGRDPVLEVSIRSRLDEPGERASWEGAQHVHEFQSAPGSMSRENRSLRVGHRKL